MMYNNVVDKTIGFHLHEVPMGKKDLKEYLSAYCKHVRHTLEENKFLDWRLRPLCNLLTSFASFFAFQV